jgi:hypothetical protein
LSLDVNGVVVTSPPGAATRQMQAIMPRARARRTRVPLDMVIGAIALLVVTPRTALVGVACDVVDTASTARLACVVVVACDTADVVTTADASASVLPLCPLPAPSALDGGMLVIATSMASRDARPMSTTAALSASRALKVIVCVAVCPHQHTHVNIITHTRTCATFTMAQSHLPSAPASTRELLATAFARVRSRDTKITMCDNARAPHNEIAST